MATMYDGNLLTQKQVQQRLGGITRQTLYNYRKKGLLTFQPIGSRVMYSQEDIQRFLELQQELSA